MAPSRLLPALVLVAGSAAAQDAPPPLCEGLDGPRSVVHDGARDRYLVSCAPESSGDEGRILAVDPESGAATVFADGLEAPRGLAIHRERDYLVVAGDGRLDLLDLADARWAGELELEGAGQLGDVAAFEYVLDVTEVRRGRVHTVDVPRLRARPEGAADDADPLLLSLRRSTGLPGPTGVDWTGHEGERLVVTRTGGVVRLGSDGSIRGRLAVAPRPEGSMGIAVVRAEDGERWFATDALTGRILEIPAEGGDEREVTVLLEDGALDTPADLGVDLERGQLLVPDVRAGAVYAVPIPE